MFEEKYFETNSRLCRDKRNEHATVSAVIEKRRWVYMGQVNEKKQSENHKESHQMWKHLGRSREALKRTLARKAKIVSIKILDEAETLAENMNRDS